MSFSEYPSKLLENAVNEFASLPGIGRKTAFRLVLNLLKRDPGEVKKFGESIIKLRSEIHYCKSCHSISDSETCSICSDSGRDSSIICVVENIQDVMAVENTRQFRGIYHVLGGVISPVDGIGPADLWIDSLRGKGKGRRCQRGDHGTEHNHGRRYHQFLSLPQTEQVQHPADYSGQRSRSRRRTGIH